MAVTNLPILTVLRSQLGGMARRSLTLAVRRRAATLSRVIEAAETRLLPSAIGGVSTSGGDAGESDQDVDDPQQVVGSFLTSAGYGDPKAMAFNDVFQGGLDTCVFASTLAGAARSSLNLASRVGFVSKTGNISTYSVQLFRQNSSGQFVQTQRTVIFDGTREPEDLRLADDKEFWPAIFQRAYLEMADSLSLNYRSYDVAYGAIYGALPKREAVSGSLAQAKAIKAALDAGSPVSVSSINTGPRYIETRYGLVAAHGYTIMGIEVPSNGDLSKGLRFSAQSVGLRHGPKVLLRGACAAGNLGHWRRWRQRRPDPPSLERLRNQLQYCRDQHVQRNKH